MKRRDPFDEFAFLIRKETATSLGLSGKVLENALRALAEFDRSQDSRHRPVSRAHLVKQAADALQGLLIQRELNGVTDNLTLNRAYSIPDELWRALGYTNALE